MFTAKKGLDRKVACVEEPISTQIEINGGFKETGTNDVTVSPCGEPSLSQTVATVTPVAKWEQVSRKLAEETGASGLGGLDNGLTLILS